MKRLGAATVALELRWLEIDVKNIPIKQVKILTKLRRKNGFVTR